MIDLLDFKLSFIFRIGIAMPILIIIYNYVRTTYLLIIIKVYIL